MIIDRDAGDEHVCTRSPTETIYQRHYPACDLCDSLTHRFELREVPLRIVNGGRAVETAWICARSECAALAARMYRQTATNVRDGWWQ